MNDLTAALSQIASQPVPRKLQAFIIDDEVVDIGIPSLAEWGELKDSLMGSNVALHDEVMKFLEDSGHNVNQAPSVEVFRDAISAAKSKLGVDNLKADDSAACERYLGRKHLLQSVSEFLDKLGFAVVPYNKEPTFDPTALPFLCLVDYQIYPESDAGATATSIFSKLMQLCQSKEAPPFVILMSKKLSDNDADKWAELAEKAGFFRSNYAFLNKDNFLRSEGYLEYLIRHFLHHRELTQAYYLNVQSFVLEAHKIAHEVSTRLLQVTPPEAIFFKEKVDKEGSSLAKELRFLFSETLAHRLQESPELTKQTRNFEEIISRGGVPVPYKQTRSALHKLYADWLHSPCDSSLNEPDFGDVYEDAGKRLYLILTQECDIATRGKSLGASVRVLAIEGEIRAKSMGNSDGDYYIDKPYYDKANDRLEWVWWNLKKPVVFLGLDFAGSPIDGGMEFTAPKLNKKYHLRTSHAEDIQHRFAMRMTKVGLNLMPDFIQMHFVKCEASIPAHADLILYELRTKKKLALAPESHAVCREINAGSLISADLIKKLSNFIDIETFHGSLKSENLLMIRNGNCLQLVKLTRQNSNTPAWKGSEKEPLSLGV